MYVCMYAHKIYNNNNDIKSNESKLYDREFNFEITTLRPSSPCPLAPELNVYLYVDVEIEMLRVEILRC